MTDNEMLEAMRDLLKPINIRLENMENEIANLKYEVKKGFRKNNDEIQTLVAVLESKGILPIAK